MFNNKRIDQYFIHKITKVRKMKNLKLIYQPILFIIIFSASNSSQSLFVVQLSNFSFTPSNLTIEVGDTVRWTNVLGTHNVLADDGSFTSGPPQPAPWNFTRVFNTAGSFPYYCEPHGGPGGSGMSGVIAVETPVSVPDQGAIPHAINLYQNFPNPFNPSTIITYSISNSSFIELKVYDNLGKEIANLVSEEKSPGIYNVEYNAANLPSGIYFFELRAGGYVSSKKMILIK